MYDAVAPHPTTENAIHETIVTRITDFICLPFVELNRVHDEEIGVETLDRGGQSLDIKTPRQRGITGGLVTVEVQAWYLATWWGCLWQIALMFVGKCG